MKKIIILLTVIALFTTSCENAQKNTESSNNKSDVVVADEIAILNIADFDNEAGNYVGKKVQLEGTVDHICKHGGQKLFLVSDKSDARIKVTPDEEIAAFNAELEGDNIVLVGIVEEQRIDEDYIREWEEEIKSGIDMGDDKGEGSHLGGKMEKGGVDADTEAEMKKIENLRDMLNKSENNYLSFYSVLCTSYTTVDDKDSDGDPK
jgi:hypothetical protein